MKTIKLSKEHIYLELPNGAIYDLSYSEGELDILRVNPFIKNIYVRPHTVNHISIK